MLKIHYLSAHSVLEYDEVSLLTELGHEVFSNGAYLDPAGHYLLPRPAINGAKYYEDFANLARAYPKTKLPRELISPFDVIIIMHTPEWILNNWQLFREFKKTIIWRSIGQSTPRIEKVVKFYAAEGLKIIRYSPKEKFINGFAGEHAMIRFYKDENEFNNWNGKNNEVVNFTQSLKGRRTFCHHDEIIQLISDFNSKVYGPGNDDLGKLNGGDLPYQTMKQKLRDSKVFVYGGSWPASYTLAFMEAFMTGIPIVSIGKNRAEKIEGIPEQNFYEIQDFIQDGVTGFISDDLDYLKSKIRLLLSDNNLASSISKNARAKAIELFGKEKIKNQWKEFLQQYEK